MTSRVLFSALLLAAAFGNARAESKQWPAAWEGTDTALLAGAVFGLAVDWTQTRKLTYVSESTQTARVSTSPRRQFGLPPVGEPLTGSEIVVSQQRWRPHQEGNRALGHEPTNAEINRYFIVTTAATVGLAYVLPQTWRRVFLGGVIVTQAVVVLDNHARLDLRLNF